MPVKNAGNFLEECLLSVISQTYPHWELIAVDDHSRDNSMEILEKYSKRDKRIRYLKNPSTGIIPALRTAYEVSNGEYIHRMDADDIMPKAKLETLLHILKIEGEGTVATGKVKYFSDAGISEGYRKYEAWINKLCESNTHWQEIYKECVVASPCWMVHRSDFEKCGAFNSDLYPEDYDLVFRFYKNRLKIVASKEVLHMWRDHAERSSRNLKHYAAQSFYELKLKYFLQLEYRPEKKLLIWGAGKKGKRLAKLLKQKNIVFQWASNNPNKHGKEIYEKILYDIEEALKTEAQIIVSVAQKNAKSEIKTCLKNTGLTENIDYWFFS